MHGSGVKSRGGVGYPILEAKLQETRSVMLCAQRVTRSKDMRTFFCWVLP